jgi:hypothetical protein
MPSPGIPGRPRRIASVTLARKGKKMVWAEGREREEMLSHGLSGQGHQE